jgi:hypothetical protein
MTYANVFSEMVFDFFPGCCKWDHAIKLECKPSPIFCKVYPMTLTEQTEMDTDNLNTTQTPEYTKDKYNVKIMK